MKHMHHRTFHVEPAMSSATDKGLTPAGAWLMRRHHVPREIANCIAELAGLSAEYRNG